MTNRFLIVNIISLLICAVIGAPAFGQNCNTDYELIFEFEEPQIGSYNVWDSVIGMLNTQERFVSGLVSKERRTVVAGEKSAGEGGDPGLLVVDVDRRGRIYWQEEHKIPGLSEVVKILDAPDGYVVFANVRSQRKDSVWIGFLDGQGGLKSQRVKSHPEGDLQVKDAVKLFNNEGYMLAVSFDGYGQDLRRYGSLYRINLKGQDVYDRSYLPGLENGILGITALPSGGFLATGYIFGEDGRRNGWALRLDNQANIIWQQQYPRGIGAWLNKGVSYLDRFFVVLGEALPAARHGNRAAWVMLLQADSGTIGWQRYYRGKLDYYGRDLFASADGLISVLLDGDPPDKDTKEDYVRLLTINPRGYLFIADEYFNDEGTDAQQLILGPATERIIIGSTRAVYQIEGEGDEPPVIKRSRDGWMIAAESTGPYDDPCVRPFTFLP